jgi:hypothetical protein
MSVVELLFRVQTAMKALFGSTWTMKMERQFLGKASSLNKSISIEYV